MSSKLTQRTLRPELTTWVAEGLVPATSADAILARYPEGDVGSRMVSILVGLGVTLLLAGISILISANWSDLPPLVKLLGFLALLLGTGWIAIRLKQRQAHQGWWDSACAMWAVLPLLGLALISQIFHADGRLSTLLIAWLAIILPLPWLTRSVGVFAIFLIGLFFAIVVDLDFWASKITGSTWRGDFDEYCSIVFLYGLGAAAISQLWNPAGERRLAATGEYLGVLTALSAMYTFALAPAGRPIWGLVWVATVGAATLLIYRAVRIGDRDHQINAALLIIGLVILSFYIRLAGTMLDTALVFFSGGALFIAAAWLIGKARRWLLDAAKRTRAEVSK